MFINQSRGPYAYAEASLQRSFRTLFFWTTDHLEHLTCSITAPRSALPWRCRDCRGPEYLEDCVYFI